MCTKEISYLNLRILPNYCMTCNWCLESHLNFTCVQLVTDLEDQNLGCSEGGSICLIFVGSLMKIFQLFPVRKSLHEPTFLSSD